MVALLAINVATMQVRIAWLIPVWAVACDGRNLLAQMHCLCRREPAAGALCHAPARARSLALPLVTAPPRPLLSPQLAALWPATYCKWREPLCVLSHIAHKLAQVAVTLAPRVGTVYSGVWLLALD